MNNNNSTNSLHTFHIPVMGLAFTIDSPIRVAHFGIDSVISIVDDELIERMNAFYSQKFNLPYQEVTKKIADFRAKRITNYLNLVDTIVTQKFHEFKQELIENVNTQKYFKSILPDTSPVKKKIQEFIDQGITSGEKIKAYFDHMLHPGSIDVNIMTKVDKENFENGEALPGMFNDAHASLRGFAHSNLSSSLVLSAGMNPKLYSYIENFEDFYPNADGYIKKKVILKVSDFRSAQIQSRFLAQKGIWVSEFRIESGLNCGGHAFASDGYLLGPILEEFIAKKDELKTTAFEGICKALETKNRTLPSVVPDLKITVQGGVGTAEEHQFLLNHYQVDSVGWGSPFLLVKEATCVDDETRKLLASAKEEDLYLSELSPLGVSFNTVRNTTNDYFRTMRVDKGRPGSSCPKKYLALHTLNGESQVCVASRKFQEAQIEDLRSRNLPGDVFEKLKTEITEKACLCVGLANTAYLEHHLPIKGEAQGVTVCPGPNIAYFEKEVTLQQMVQHIYGGTSIINESNRPNMFIKELYLYLDAYRKAVDDAIEKPSVQADKKVARFKTNLDEGIHYYKSLFATVPYFAKQKEEIIAALSHSEETLESALATVAKTS